MTGAHWRLCVVDCDGEEAITVWREMLHHGTGPCRPGSSRTGGGGLALLFSLPAWLDECPSRRLWGVWDTWAGTEAPATGRSIKEVRLLADRASAIAPPSGPRHDRAALRVPAGPSPKEFPRPMEAWPWLLNMPAIVNPQMFESPDEASPDPVKTPTRPAGEFWDRDEVLAAIATRSAWLDPGASAWPSRRGTRKAGGRATRSTARTPPPRPRSTRSPGCTPSSATAASCRSSTWPSRWAYGSWEDAKNDLGARFLGVRPRGGKIPA
jgi:hypothetical protein